MEIEYRILIERNEKGTANNITEGNISETMKKSAEKAFELGKWSSVEFIQYTNQGGIIQYFRK